MATSTPTIPSVFLDSSAFFAATYSATGSARDLVLAALQSRIRLVLSPYVIEETERNLLKRAPQAHPDFLIVRDNVPYQLIDPAPALIADSARVVAPKDAPIIAAARAAQARFVATYDRKDLLSKEREILDAFGIMVATPNEILTDLGGARDRL
jgi:predicted nucleic acid-binding protein